jgi:arylsulfatase A-like enzyme
MRTSALPLLALALSTTLGAACARRPDGPNILLITLDTTRRDHLGMYGYTIPTSPNLDALAKDSVVYTNAYAVSSWTMPTHASMFTGKFPSAHGANYDPDGPLKLSEAIGEQFGHYRARPIAENEITLAQLLSEHGYATAGIIAGPWMMKAFRLGKGFEHYDDDGVTALNGRPAEDVTTRAIEYVDEHADEPFFLFLNYYDPHSPTWDDGPKDAQGNLTRPPKALQDPRPVYPPGVDLATVDGIGFARICYDAEIRYMDREIGRFLEHLKQRGLYEDTWIFVLSDHGDLLGDPVLGEKGLWGHGDSLTQAEIHIPFFVKEPGPGGRTGTDASMVQQVDILPTVLARLGLPLPPNVQGTVLGGKHLTVAELYKLPMMNRVSGPNPKDWRHLGDWRVIVDGTDKFGWSSNGTHFLIDLAKDPGERVNALTQQAERGQQLEGILDAYLRGLPKPGEVGEVEQPGAEALEALKGLGYTGVEK